MRKKRKRKPDAAVDTETVGAPKASKGAKDGRKRVSFA